jgi:hypothetical protein
MSLDHFQSPSRTFHHCPLAQVTSFPANCVLGIIAGLYCEKIAARSNNPIIHYMPIFEIRYYINSNCPWLPQGGSSLSKCQGIFTCYVRGRTLHAQLWIKVLLPWKWISQPNLIEVSPKSWIFGCSHSPIDRCVIATCCCQARQMSAVVSHVVINLAGNDTHASAIPFRVTLVPEHATVSIVSKLRRIQIRCHGDAEGRKKRLTSSISQAIPLGPIGLIANQRGQTGVRCTEQRPAVSMDGPQAHTPDKQL